MTTCSATLTHAHGVALCRLAPHHEGRHAAYCPICIENDEDATLKWVEDGEDWTAARAAQREESTR